MIPSPKLINRSLKQGSAGPCRQMLVHWKLKQSTSVDFAADALP